MGRTLPGPYVGGGAFWPRPGDDLAHLGGRICRAYPGYRLADLLTAPLWEWDALLRALPRLEAEDNLRWGNVASLPHLTPEWHDRLRGLWMEQAGWTTPTPPDLAGLPGVIAGADETVIGDTFDKIAGWFAALGTGVTVA